MAGKSAQVIGARVPEEVAATFKMGYAERNLRLNDLLQYLWELYRKSAKQEWVNNGS